MKAREFYDAIAAHADLIWMGTSEDGTEAFVHQRTDGQIIMRAITLRSIRENPWQELEDVLMGRKNGEYIRHYSRIVGYYSRIQNWDRGKLAELKDRQRGSYVVPELAVEGAQDG